MKNLIEEVANQWLLAPSLNIMNTQDLSDISGQQQHGRERPKEENNMKRKEKENLKILSGEREKETQYREEIKTYK